MRDSGALPARHELHALCDTANLDDRDAVLLHARSNAVYHLPREGLVLRLATATPAQVDRAQKVVAVCRWLAKHDGPCLTPTDLPQPVFAAGAVATVWPFLPSSHMPTPTDLGATLRDLHGITAPPPPLPTYQPLTRLREALDLDTTRHTPALTPDQHAWLADHADRLHAAYQNLTSRLGTGLVHGDAHTENLLHDSATADRWVLIDFDHAAHGPRELDLLYAAPDHFHEPAADRHAFTRAYGHNLLTWPGWQTLRDISEAHSLASYIRRAPTTPAAATELTRRLHSLRTADPTVVWASIS
jgi:aminoglycoside phosphotransferase (APT) family kinase protein